jgi:hypothetical protein
MPVAKSIYLQPLFSVETLQGGFGSSAEPSGQLVYGKMANPNMEAITAPNEKKSDMNVSK